MNDILKIYKVLLQLYGPRGWWPLLSCNAIQSNKTGFTSTKGYHPCDYSYPKNNQQRFEICAGAVLTQNTAWINVERALFNLKRKKLLSAKAIKDIEIDRLKDAIKSAGYFNQKSRYLKELACFFISLKGKIPARIELLSVVGIGPETADSILLYAYNQPEFVVDAYTKRIFANLGFFEEKVKYNEVKEFFERKLPEDIVVYQEYHALIVEHAKRYYSKRGEYEGCPLVEFSLNKK